MQQGVIKVLKAQAKVQQGASPKPWDYDSRFLVVDPSRGTFRVFANKADANGGSTPPLIAATRIVQAELANDVPLTITVRLEIDPNKSSSSPRYDSSPATSITSEPITEFSFKAADAAECAAWYESLSNKQDRRPGRAQSLQDPPASSFTSPSFVQSRKITAASVDFTSKSPPQIKSSPSSVTSPPISPRQNNNNVDTSLPIAPEPAVVTIPTSWLMMGGTCIILALVFGSGSGGNNSSDLGATTRNIDASLLDSSTHVYVDMGPQHNTTLANITRLLFYASLSCLAAGCWMLFYRTPQPPEQERNTLTVENVTMAMNALELALAEGHRLEQIGQDVAVPVPNSHDEISVIMSQQSFPVDLHFVREVTPMLGGWWSLGGRTLGDVLLRGGALSSVMCYAIFGSVMFPDDNARLVRVPKEMISNPSKSNSGTGDVVGWFMLAAIGGGLWWKLRTNSPPATMGDGDVVQGGEEEEEVSRVVVPTTTTTTATMTNEAKIQPPITNPSSPPPQVTSPVQSPTSPPPPPPHEDPYKDWPEKYRKMLAEGHSEKAVRLAMKLGQ